MATAQQAAQSERTCFDFPSVAARYGVSKDMLRRLAEAGDLKTIYIGGRRLIPLSEVLRVESEGIGAPRKRGWKRTRKQKAGAR